jgi:16S rRNA G966 N2-methylase RsmD
MISEQQKIGNNINSFLAGKEGITPLVVANKIVANIPEELLKNPNSKFLEPAAGVGTIVSVLFEKLLKYHDKVHILENMLYLVEINPFKYAVLKKLGYINVYQEDTLEKDFNNMKFSAVLANPPYKKGLHLKFLNKALTLSDKVVFVHPSAWVLTKTHDKKATKPEEDCIEAVNKYSTDFELINGNKLFSGAVFFYPLIVTDIDKSKPNKGFKVTDSIHNNTLEFDNFKDINLHFSDDVFLSLRNKLIDVVKTDNFFSNESLKYGEYGITISKIRGSHCKESYFKSDFYTLVPRVAKPVNREEGNDFTFWSSTEEEASNMLSYLKSDFVRFCLSLYKVTNNIKSGSIHKSIPVVDFTQNWTDSKLYEHFNITEQEQEYISKIIPHYYDY